MLQDVIFVFKMMSATSASMGIHLMEKHARLTALLLIVTHVHPILLAEHVILGITSTPALVNAHLYIIKVRPSVPRNLEQIALNVLTTIVLNAHQEILSTMLRIYAVRLLLSI